MARVTEAITPILDAIRKDIFDIRTKAERDSAVHDEIVKTLRKIEEQTTKTNGRVGDLEKKEVLNSAVRYLIGVTILGILAIAGGRFASVVFASGS